MLDPVLKTTLDNADNRSACYRCHPGSTTRCLRGAMGGAVAADGTMAMQCQSCHGNMTQVGAASRVGWFMEPSCQSCHSGPSHDSINSAVAPSVANVWTNTSNDQAVSFGLPVTGVGATARIISQPANGSVGLSNGVATYFPNPGFVGSDTFTFAAYDGSKNSGLSTGTVAVVQGSFGLSAVAYAPPSYPVGWPVAFTGVPAVTNNTSAVTCDWDFGDGSAHGSGLNPTHAYSLPGVYHWSVVCSVAGAQATTAGSIQINAPVQLAWAAGQNSLTLSWPLSLADTILEASSVVGPGAQWAWVTNAPSVGPDSVSVTVATPGPQFFRVRRPW